MTDKRYLFRGFHRDENGTTVITLNSEKIRGEWIYGYVLKEKYDIRKTFIRYFPNEDDDYIDEVVIPETVGQFVITDKNGKDIFLGDKIRIYYTYTKNDYPMIGFHIGVIGRNTFGFSFNCEDYLNEWVEDSDNIELIGNKWECAE